MAKKQTTKKLTGAKKGRGKTSAPPPPPPKKNGQTTVNTEAGRSGNAFGGVFFLLLAACSAISYFNTDGSFVAFFTTWLKGLLGWGFYLAAPAFTIAAILLFTSKNRPVGARVFAAVMLPILLAALSDLLLNSEIRPGVGIWDAINDLFEDGRVMKSGGVVGGLIANGLNTALSIYGALPILLAGFLYSLIVTFWGSLHRLLSLITQSHNAYVEYEHERAKNPPKNVNRPADLTARKAPKVVTGDRRSTFGVDIPLGDDDEEVLNAYGAPEYQKTQKTKTASPKTKKTPTIIHELQSGTEDGLKPADDYFDSPNSSGSASTAPIKPAAAVPAPKPVKVTRPTKIETVKRDEIQAERENIEQAIAQSGTPDDYVFPPLTLLRASSIQAADATDEVNLNRRRLEEAIQSFGISAAVVGVIRGPTVTRYDIELDRGVKLARVTNLAGDLALSLGVVNVRIAPIPDRISTVGIEVPNRTVSTVFLRDILESGNFSGAKSKLSFALGKDIGGNCIVGNISKLPHLLIAGTTGSGKSVCMNSLILSLLYKARPDEVKLIMIDPKMVELGIYNGIPHLYVPVVTDPKKAAGALQWSVVEMMKRYRAFSETGVRDLDSFNRIRKEKQEETLPRVVIVIDELADLMLVASKEVEESICRVAQMGRAAGMHLVIATQRPSADVITGLMKANIPSRIAFAVSSALESRIILDQSGAEKLIGFGDMLYAPLGSGKPTRIQGSFVSDEEREEVIRFIKENNLPGAEKSDTNKEIEDYMIKATRDKSDSGEKDSAGDGPSGDYDEMLPQAVEVVLEMGSCSVSMLQRRIKLGYSRAARIVDQMEELGVVGPYEGAKPRSVTIDRAAWHELQVQLGYLPADDAGEPFPDPGIDPEADDYDYNG